jgi:hypothetical protein
LKPHNITKGFAGTVIAAWKFGKQINWAAIMLKNIRKMVSSLTPEKPCYLSPYIAHVYCKEEVFTLEEESAYDHWIIKWKFHLKVKAEDAEKQDGDDQENLEGNKSV